MNFVKNLLNKLANLIFQQNQEILKIEHEEEKIEDELKAISNEIQDLKREIKEKDGVVHVEYYGRQTIEETKKNKKLLNEKSLKRIAKEKFKEPNTEDIIMAKKAVSNKPKVTREKKILVNKKGGKVIYHGQQDLEDNKKNDVTYVINVDPKQKKFDKFEQE